MPDLLSAMRIYLVEQAVGRMPRVAGVLPPIWAHPLKGTPAPGENPGAPDGVEIGPDAVLALYRAGGLRSGLFEAWLARPIVDVHVRARTVPGAVELARQVRVAMLGVSAAPRTNWTMAGLQVIAAQEWRPVQPLPVAQGVLFTTAFLFNTYA